VNLNVNCRDEIIPILRALQHLYANVALRDELLELVGRDVNQRTSRRRGRRGLSYWDWPQPGWAATWITTSCKIWPRTIGACARSWAWGRDQTTSILTGDGLRTTCSSCGPRRCRR